RREWLERGACDSLGTGPFHATRPRVALIPSTPAASALPPAKGRLVRRPTIHTGRQRCLSRLEADARTRTGTLHTRARSVSTKGSRDHPRCSQVGGWSYTFL